MQDITQYLSDLKDKHGDSFHTIYNAGLILARNAMNTSQVLGLQDSESLIAVEVAVRLLADHHAKKTEDEVNNLLKQIEKLGLD